MAETRPEVRKEIWRELNNEGRAHLQGIVLTKQDAKTLLRDSARLAEIEAALRGRIAELRRIAENGGSFNRAVATEDADDLQRVLDGYST